MTTLLLVNPAAGHGRAARLAAEAERAIGEVWGAVERVDTHRPGEAVDRVRERVEGGVERVVVLGGDGTLHEAANGLLAAQVRQRPPLAILPAGTGNDYAKLTRTLGPSIATAVRRLHQGTMCWHDAGQAWDEFFINSIGIGFDAEVARQVNESRHGTGLPAYLAAVVRVIARFQPFEVEVRSDDREYRDRLLLLEIGIGPVVGGGFRLTPFALPDDGLFDICAIQELSTLGILAKLPLAMLGRHTKLRAVRSYRATRIEVASTGAPLQAQFDGELRQRSSQMDIRICPGALPVLIAHP